MIARVFVVVALAVVGSACDDEKDAIAAASDYVAKGCCGNLDPGGCKECPAGTRVTSEKPDVKSSCANSCWQVQLTVASPTTRQACTFQVNKSDQHVSGVYCSPLP